MKPRRLCNRRIWIAVTLLFVLSPGLAAAVFRVKSLVLLQAADVLSLLLAWTFLRWRGQKWSDVGLKTVNRPARLALETFVVAAILTAAAEALKPIAYLIADRDPDLAVFHLIRGNPTALCGGLILAWTAGAFAEELVFRGFLLNCLHEVLQVGLIPLSARWPVALLLSSLAFGCDHAYQGPAGMLLTGFAGLGFGTLYLWHLRNLWPSIFTHAFVNTIGLVLLFFGQNG